MKILLIDDSKTAAAAANTTLEDLGHEVTAINNPLDSLKTFKKISPDLIILDIAMDKKNGFECAKEIRQYQQGKDWVPIIFLSGTASEENIVQGIDAGGDDYLTKPLNKIILAAKIKAMQRIVDMRDELIVTTEELKALSSTDTLTHIPNRSEYERNIALTTATSKRHKRQFALLFLDLDNFKSVNDNLGHHAGDLLLQEVANRLQSATRSTDFIARMGGDEFAVILNEIRLPEDAGGVAKKIISAMQPPFQLDSNDLHIGFSIGIACYPLAGQDASTLAKNADIAMYRAKSTGRNKFQYFTNELNESHGRKTTIENGLQFSIERNELSLRYQPQYTVAEQKLAGMEVLVRWNNTELGEVSPGEFIPIAEKSHFITPLGDWIFKEAFQQIAAWQQHNPLDIIFSINISPVQLTQTTLVKDLKNHIKENKIDPKQIQLELTETAIMSYSAAAENMLHELNALGITISIDDFGTGYSSLSHLKRLPVQALKIDRSFVKDITNDANDAMIVKSVISLAHSLNLGVVAEGVETEQQLQFFNRKQLRHCTRLLLFKTPHCN